MNEFTATATIPAPSITMSVADNVKAEMVKAGLNPFSLCRLAGLSRSTFNRRLRGDGEDFTMAELLTLARALKVAPSVFFGADGKTVEADQFEITLEDEVEFLLYPMRFVARAEFDGGDVTGSAWTMDGGKTVEAEVCLDGGMDEMTSADFRTMADKYEAFPAWLRAFADTLDGLAEGRN